MARLGRRRSSVAALGLALFSLVVACGPPEAQRPLASNPLGGGDVASPVNLVESPGHPVVATLVREGDPVAVLSLALAADGDPAALVALAEIAAARLGDAGLAVETRVDRDALFLDVVLDRDPKAAALALRSALETPITPVPAIAARVAERVADIPSESGPAVSAVRSCSGALGTAKTAPLDPASQAGVQRIEKLRRAAFTLESAAFGVVGPEARVRAAIDALFGGDAWPKGTPHAGDDYRANTSGASIAPDLASGSMRFSLAIQAADPSGAIASAARLGRSPSALGAQAERSGFRLARLSGVARPRGACVTAVFEGRVPKTGPGEGREISEVVTELARVAEREVRAELAVGAGPLEAAQRIASSADPREAARLAAWWALSRPIPEAPPAGRGLAAALELASDQPEPLRASIEKSLSTALASAAKPEPGVPPVATRVERGQAETWVLVANPCAIASEAPHRWGAAAFATLSAATRAQAAARTIDPDIAIEPFVSGRGIGFIAHAPRSSKKPAADLARDLATAATTAFFVAPPSADDVLAAEGIALDRLRKSFGPAAPGLAELGAKLGEHPSVLEPLGLPLRLARFDPIDLGRRLRATGEGSLSVALLAENDNDAEGRAAAAAVARFSAPTSAAQCPSVSPPIAGRFEVREPRKGPSRVYWLFRSDASPKARAHARVLAALIAKDGQGARAQVIDARDQLWLLVDASAPDDDLARIERQTSDLLAKLASAAIDDATLSRAIGDGARADLRSLSDPRERLARLIGNGGAEPAPAVDAGELREWLKRSLAAERATIVVARPE